MHLPRYGYTVQELVAVKFLPDPFCITEFEFYETITFHLKGLYSSMGEKYWMLAEETLRKCMKE